MTNTDAAPVVDSSGAAAPPQVLSRGDIRQLDLVHFQGPIDLLLALVRRRQVELFEIPIATITADYLYCLDVMEEEISLEITGDFLAIASALVLLKSQRLLPRKDQIGEDTEAVVRSEEELLRRLAALEQFQEIAEALWDGPVLGRDTFTRSPAVTVPTGRKPLQEPPETLSETLRELVRSRTPRRLHEIIERGLSLASAVHRILRRLSVLLKTGVRSIEFPSLLKETEGRLDAIALFSALLELAKLRHVRLDQPTAQDPLVLSPGEHAPDMDRAQNLLTMFDAQTQ